MPQEHREQVNLAPRLRVAAQLMKQHGSLVAHPPRSEGLGLAFTHNLKVFILRKKVHKMFRQCRLILPLSNWKFGGNANFRLAITPALPNTKNVRTLIFPAIAADGV